MTNTLHLYSLHKSEDNSSVKSKKSDILEMTSSGKTSVIAQSGLIAKGVVYCILGALAFMAAFEIGGQSNDNTDKEAVFDVVRKQTGGQILLALLVAGLFCYSAWRFIETFRNNNANGKKNHLGRRFRYAFSGIIYLTLAVYGGKLLLSKPGNNGNSTETRASQILSQPFGAWLLGLVALIIAGVGVYQIYYGFAEKYRDHVSKLNLNSGSASALLTAGKIGYIARGIVWLIISWLILKAAINHNSKEAGDTAKAFGFLEDSPYGSYLLGALAIGLICYGLFNFIRARYERL